ncbi:MAG: LemA family protein [Nitrospirota bacterium]|nr:LemA family protein [Nitrospirota bacterium]
MSVKVLAGIAGSVLFLLIVIYIYNKLVRLRYAVRTSWSDIDVHLKKRYELLPNLVEAVKAYAAHESDTLVRVTQQRSAAMQARTPQEKARADNMLTATLKSLFAIAEAYPELKADSHYREIMTNMKEIDDNIEHARRFYNAMVRDYNVTTEIFPMNIVAAAFSFKQKEFFALDNEEERKPVRADFSRKQ